MSCVITWALSFLTSEVLEAVRGQKHLLGAHFGNNRFIPQCQFCLLKISYDFQPPYLEF